GIAPGGERSMMLARNQLMTTVALPALVRADGWISFTNNDALTAARFPMLTTTLELVVQDSSAVIEVLAPKLASVRDLRLSSLPQLTTIELTELLTVDRYLNITATGLTDLDGLTSLTYAQRIDV